MCEMSGVRESENYTKAQRIGMKPTEKRNIIVKRLLNFIQCKTICWQLSFIFILRTARLVHFFFSELFLLSFGSVREAEKVCRQRSSNSSNGGGVGGGEYNGLFHCSIAINEFVFGFFDRIFGWHLLGPHSFRCADSSWHCLLQFIYIIKSRRDSQQSMEIECEIDTERESERKGERERESKRMKRRIEIVQITLT